MAKLPTIDYQRLFNTLPGRYIAMLPDDPHFTIVAVNEAHTEMTGFSRDDLIGKPVLEAFPDTSPNYKKTGVSEYLESVREVVRTKKSNKLPILRYDIEGPDGTMDVKYWQVTQFPLMDEDGEVALLCQAVDDITEEVKTGTKLEVVQQQLREALSAGVIGTWLWDIKGDTVIGDQYMAGMFGVKPDEAAKGLSLAIFVEAIHPDDRERVSARIAEVLGSDEIYEADYRTIDDKGNVHWLIARGRVERDENGQPEKFPGVLIDITDRKQIEINQQFLSEAGVILSSSLEYTKTLNSIAQLAVPRIADWCAVDILGESGELEQVAVVHKDPKKVKLALDIRKKQGPPDLNGDTGMAKVIKTGEAEFYPQIPEEVLRASAKDEQHLKMIKDLGLTSAIMVPLRIQQETIGVITLVTAEQKRLLTKTDLDTAKELANRASMAINNAYLYKQAQLELTERKRLEEALRVINEDLERRVSERTEQLGETNRNLERSNQELQDFAYVASHDLQEPLRKIQAFGNLLQEEYGGKLGEGADYLNRMRGAAARMSTLIEDILSFSRVTTQAREFSRVDMNVITTEVLDDLETRIQDTGATIKVDKLPVIMADPVQMRQLLQNLIANALKFHKPDVQPVITISAQIEISQTGRTRYAKLTIEDNGVGFDEKYLDRIFAVFQRLHSRDAYEGTGIGLAVCRKIVERHGGTITAHGQPDKGATFIIHLPVHHKKGERL